MMNTEEVEVAEAYLPPELWHHIFSYLNHFKDLISLSFTCKAFGPLAWAQWRYFDLSPYQAKVTDPVLLNLIHNSPQLRTLALYRATELSDSTLDQLISSCPQLEWLSLDYCTSLLPNFLYQLANLFPTTKEPEVQEPKIRGLHLKGWRRLTDEVVQLCFGSGRLSDLEELGLACCTQLTVKSLLHIAKACPSLKLLKLKGCYKVTQMGVQTVIEKCTQLQTLNLEGLQIITDSTLKYLAANHPLSLRSLNIWGCKVTDAGVEELFKNCHQLEELIMKRCTQVTDEPFQYLAFLHNVKVLDLQSLSIGPSAIKAIYWFCSHSLEQLDVRDCANVTSEALSQLVSECKQLKLLRMRSPLIDDQCLKAICLSLSQLEVLDFQNCENVSMEAIRQLADENRCVCFHSLQLLTMVGAQTFTEEDVAWFQTKLPHVRLRITSTHSNNN
jgi:hypothetical protein